jgi:hypothetical protein
MKIIRNEEVASFTFVPVEEGEAEILDSIIAIAKPEDKMEYGGRNSDDKSYVVYLHVGSHAEKRTEINGNVTAHWEEEVGGIKLELRGSTENDQREVRLIRDVCYFGSGGLILVGSYDLDGKRVVVTTAKRCKLCRAGMIDFGSCEWGVCGTCAGKCELHYVLGVVHGGSAGNIGMGEFCEICGRSKSEAKDERKKEQVERELEVQRETWAQVMYTNGPFQTPQHAVDFNRLVRRYRKALSR